MRDFGTREKPISRRLRLISLGVSVLLLAGGAVAAVAYLNRGGSPIAVQSVRQPTGDDEVGMDTSTEAVQGTCSPELVANIEYGFGPSQSQDISVIEDALAVQLPAGPACVLTVPGDTQDSTAYYIYWPNKGQSFAQEIGQDFLQAGYRAAAGDLAFSTSGASATAYAYASDGEWADFFDGAQLVLLVGQFDGAPGKKALAAPNAGSGEVYSFKSACMLSVDEINLALNPTGVIVGQPEEDFATSAACDYRQSNAGSDVPGSISIDFHPYDDSASYGWAVDGQSWTAPSADEGAAILCAAASLGVPTDGPQTICGDVGATHFVIAADRYDALVFPPGDYFYSVGVFSMAGTDALTTSLTQITKLLADRTPVPE